jgi:NAD(P)-dependent dehydrogenase (short-subunit alcohol dehydrogenase family)
MGLEGKTAFVTGASRGIGRAICMSLAERGANIVAVARVEPVPGTVEETAALVETLGCRALPIELDVTDEDAVKAAIARSVEAFGGIDILVNNAGTNMPSPVRDIEAKRWELVMKVNALAPFLCSKYAIPVLPRDGTAHILNISSVRAVQPKAGSSAYCASKAALEALTTVLAQELHSDCICVNAIRLEGTVATPGTMQLMHTTVPSERLWPVEIMGEAAAYICSRRFPFSGQVRTIKSLRRNVARIDEILATHPSQEGTT